MMTSSLVCADASLTLKLVLDEPDSTLAEALWSHWQTGDVTIIAPTLWAYEVTSVIRNRVYRSLYPADDEAEALRTLFALEVQLLTPDGLHLRAWEIARQLYRSAAYDAHYLALAEIVGCPFWTADERLFNAAHATFDWVYWLGSFRPSGTTA
jgi:predicted nucleic acid-binding protein